MFDKVHVTVFLVNFVIFTGFINGFNVERKNDRFRRSPASEDAVEVIHKPKRTFTIIFIFSVLFQKNICFNYFS